MMNDDLGVLSVAEDVLRKAERRAGKPLGSRHRPASQDALVWSRGVDMEVLPDRFPEGLELGDGPPPERFVICEAPAPCPLQPLRVFRDICAGNLLRRRAPQDVRHLHEPRIRDGTGILRDTAPRSGRLCCPPHRIYCQLDSGSISAKVRPPSRRASWTT